MRRVVFLLAVLCSAKASAATRFAFIVGTNIGDASETPLRWAESDASRMRQALETLGGVDPKRATMLVRPTLAGFDSAWVDLKNRLKESAKEGESPTLFFYFSGHGDAEALHFGRERLALSALMLQLKTSPAAVTVAILDACRNHRTPRVQNKGALRAPEFEWPSEPGSSHEGFVLITSAAKGEVAQESDDLQGSLFTHHLLGGMAGVADENSDGTVTLEELYRHGYARTLEQTHGRGMAIQHGELQSQLAGQGSFTMTFPRKAETLLELEPNLRSSVLLVDDASGRIAAEIFAPGRLLRVAVPSGRYRAQVREGEQILSGLIHLGRGVQILDLSKLRPQPTESVLEKGAQWDPHPWSLQIAGSMGHGLTEVGPGFGGSVGLDRRLGDAWRVGIHATGMALRSQQPQWTISEQHLFLHASLEYALPLGFFVGVRGGALVLFQQRRRVNAPDIERLFPASAADRAWSTGATFGPSFGTELNLGPRTGLTLAVHPSCQVSRIDDALHVGWNAALQLGLRMRL